MMRYMKLQYMLFIIAVSFSMTATSQQLPDFVTLAKEASPAVVNISTVQKARQASNQDPFSQFGSPFGDDVPDIFRHFFRGLPESSPQPRQNPTPRSLGSGFIISEDGYILTNHHVIRDAERVIVRLNDRRELDAEVIGSDPRSDVALLKVNETGLPSVKIGQSNQLEVGEWVLAIGSPFGFDYSVTSGIVSATDRSLANDTYVPFIQTDVAINPGNSGGPLFNLRGEVVGINSQIYTRSGGFMGLSFAIPMDVAMSVADQLREKGSVSRGWLGVVIQEVSRDLAESFGLDTPRGALIVRTLPESPAQFAGLLEGDIIVQFNGVDINKSSELPYQVGRIKPGDKANMVVIRGGERKNLSVTIGLLPEEDELVSQMQGQRSGEESAPLELLGLVVQPLTENDRSVHNVSSGILIADVLQGPGAAAGLLRGDVITMMNGEQIQTVKQFSQVVEDLPKGKAVPMRIVRRGSALFIPIRL